MHRKVLKLGSHDVLLRFFAATAAPASAGSGMGPTSSSSDSSAAATSTAPTSTTPFKGAVHAVIQRVSMLGSARRVQIDRRLALKVELVNLVRLALERLGRRRIGRGVLLRHRCDRTSTGSESV